MFKYSRKSICIMLSLAMLISSVTGCTGGTNETSKLPDTEKSNSKDTVVIGLISEPNSLVPGLMTDNYTEAIKGQMFDQLLQKSETGEYSGYLAESWEVSEDLKEVKLFLKKGIKFHNGYDFTAEDVVFSMDFMANSVAGDYRNLMPNYIGAEALDDHTVVIHYSKPYGPILNNISDDRLGILSKRYMEEVGEEGYNNKPVGTGPYKFVERVIGDKVVLERNEDWWNGKAGIKNIVYKIITDSDTLALALESGSIDASHCVSLSDKARLSNAANLNWYQRDGLNTCFLIFNTKGEIMSNIKLRKAIAHAINKQDILTGAFENEGLVINNMIAPNSIGYPGETPFYEYDIDKAKQLFAEAGYPNGLKMIVETHSKTTYQKPFEVFQAQMVDLGLDLQLNVVESKVYWERMAARDFEIAIVTFSIPSDDADSAVYNFYSNDGSFTYAQIMNDDLHKAVSEARETNDLQKRIELYKEASDIVYEGAYIIPLCLLPAYICHNNELKNVRTNSSSRIFVEEWSY